MIASYYTISWDCPKKIFEQEWFLVSLAESVQSVSKKFASRLGAKVLIWETTEERGKTPECEDIIKHKGILIKDITIEAAGI